MRVILFYLLIDIKILRNIIPDVICTYIDHKLNEKRVTSSLCKIEKYEVKLQKFSTYN